MADKTILTLSTTEFDRPQVSIDGRMYEMRSPDELGVAMMRAMNGLAERIKKAQDPAAEVDGDGDRLDELASAIADGVDQVMVALPVEVRDALTIRQQSRLVMTFGKLASDDKLASTTD